MKIQENTSQTNLHTLTSRKAGSLATLMHSTNQHSGPAYYWQHQHHLQQSELQFKSNHSHKSLETLQSIHQKKMDSTPDFSSGKIAFQPDNPDTSSLTKLPENTASFSNFPAKIFTQALIKNAYAHFINQPGKNTVFPFKKHKLIKQTSRTKPAIPHFKKQRIFQEFNQLEISINWPDFHKKITAQRSLQQLANWFLQQGLGIKKWIINGVIQ